jgi:hypothetical protein
MSTATATLPASLPASGDARTSTLARLTGVNVQQDRDGRAFIQFSDAYKFPGSARTFRLVDVKDQVDAARTQSDKRLPVWQVFVVPPGGPAGGTVDAKPIAGAFETIAADRSGKSHGRINFTDPYTHRRYVLFVYDEPQPTPGNPQVMFHGSASVDTSGGRQAVQNTLSRFGGRPAVPTEELKGQAKQSDVGTVDLDEPQAGGDVIPF